MPAYIHKYIRAFIRTCCAYTLVNIDLYYNTCIYTFRHARFITVKFDCDPVYVNISIRKVSNNIKQGTWFSQLHPRRDNRKKRN